MLNSLIFTVSCNIQSLMWI